MFWRRVLSVMAIVALVEVGLAVAVLPGLTLLTTGVVVLLALLALAYLGSLAPATLLFSLAFAAQVLAGNSQHLGLPIGPDRLLVAAALFALVRDRWLGRQQGLPVRWNGIHVGMILLIALAVLSAAEAGTLTQREGIFALLDRLGVVPFLAYALAPRLFGTAAQRRVLLAVLVGLGAYLAGTAIAEGLRLDSLVFPRYITDDAVGIHGDRARGPFVEAVANGFALLVCAIAALVAAATWTRPRARLLARVVAAASVLGTVFTLTRAVWLAAVVAAVVAAGWSKPLRRRLVPLGALATCAVVLLVLVVPGLASSVTDRAGSQRPLWDRYNTNAAAVRVILDDPVTGIGWQRFPEAGAEYMRQSLDYPLTGAGIEVHNVPLSHAAELGLPVAVLYLLTLAAAIVAGLRGRLDEESHRWRVAMVAVVSVWAVVATFGPVSYPFANTALWLFVGVAAGCARQPRTP